MQRVTAVLLAVTALSWCAAARADQLILNNGTVLEGTVIPQKDGYWVKTSDGKTQVIASSDVKSHVKGTAETVTRPAAPSAEPPPASADFAAAKRKADAVDAPLAAVAIWQQYLDGQPPSKDKAAAEAELERWKKLADDDAERILGRWVGGAERKTIRDKADRLYQEAADAMLKNQTLVALKKLEESTKVYPNAYDPIFTLGYLQLVGHNEDQAIKQFEAALRLKPNSVDAMNNLAVATVGKKDPGRAMDLFYKAAQLEDTREVAQNLLTVWVDTPANLRAHPRFKGLEDASKLLAAKYSLSGPLVGSKYLLMPPRGSRRAPGMPDMPPGVKSSGTGFVIRDDGLILTNRHVVDSSKSLLVIMPDNTRRSAQIVKIDEEQDLALVQIKPDKKLVFAAMGKTDFPAEGSACFVLGFPLPDRMGSSIKITQGIVSGRAKAGSGADIITDAKVNPGNSGGPLVNAHGQVVGIVTMKSFTTATEDSYGMAISAGLIRKFLDKNKVAPANDPDAADTLNAEQVAAKIKPATVCILNIH